MRSSPRRGYPTRYRLRVSEDGARWSTVRTVVDGNASARAFDTLVGARYVRVEVDAQAGSYPHAIHELEVSAPP